MFEFFYCKLLRRLGRENVELLFSDTGKTFITILIKFGGNKVQNVNFIFFFNWQ